MIHFELDIKLDNYTDNWGHFLFNFPICSSENINNGILPYGSTILATDVKVYLGRIDAKTDLSAATEITTMLEADPVIQGDNEILLYFQHPGAIYNNKRASLVFELILSGGRKKSFYGYFVEIGWKAS